MAYTARAFIPSLKPLLPPAFPSISTRPLFSIPSTISFSARRPPSGVVCCLVSDVDGGGGASDIRNSEFTREFAVIADMLKRIEPFDVSVISTGVTDSAKDSMKQTISTMLGLLPSHQFSVSVRVSKLPMHRLLVSSIITGYTLWNVEYRISLVRNFELPSESALESPKCLEDGEDLNFCFEEMEMDCGLGKVSDDVTSTNTDNGGRFKDLSPQALDYIQRLEAQLFAAKKELDAQRQELLQIESNRGNNNNLLEYLRSLESDMVAELSQPSSTEVKEVIHQLSGNILQKLFQEDASSGHNAAAVHNSPQHLDSDNETIKVVTTSRDYLAKLLFWCMLLGHHLRGLENRLQLSCVVGLL